MLYDQFRSINEEEAEEEEEERGKAGCLRIPPLIERALDGGGDDV